jgi:hypothetical protein
MSRQSTPSEVSVLLRPGALRTSTPYLAAPGAGGRSSVHSEPISLKRSRRRARVTRHRPAPLARGNRQRKG